MDADSLRLAVTGLSAARHLNHQRSDSVRLHTSSTRSQSTEATAATVPSPAPILRAVSTASGQTYRDAEQRIDIGTGWTAFLKNLCELNVGPAKLRTLRNTAEHFTDGRPVQVTVPAELPVRDFVILAAAKVFAEMNSTLYILHAEDFFTMLNALYDHSAVHSNADLAIVLAVAALGGSDHNWFTKACHYIDLTIEEATFESIQALLLLSLYRLNWDDRNAAWILLGSAMRIAYTHGLHQNSSTWVGVSNRERDIRLRVWLTLYTLDVDLTCGLGRPQAPQCPENEELPLRLLSVDHNLGPDLPPGWHAASADLTLVTHRILLERCARLASTSKGPVDPRQVLADLSAWWQRLPANLQRSNDGPPSHVRAISYLSRRYHFSIIETTRSYLFNPDISNCCYARQCIEADRSLIAILTGLHHRGLLSQINYFDLWHCLGAGMILHLRALRSPTAELLAEMESFEPVVASMQHTRTGRTGLEAMRAFMEVLRGFVQSQSTKKMLLTELASSDDLEAVFEQFCQSLVAEELNWGV